MSREMIGEVLAYVPPPIGSNNKARYIKLGLAFKDERGRISLKLDAVPLPHSGWEGWVNILPSNRKPTEPPKPTEAPEGSAPDRGIRDSDIPF